MSDVPQEIIESFAARSGYLKPYEGERENPAMDELLLDDLAAIGGSL